MYCYYCGVFIEKYVYAKCCLITVHIVVNNVDVVKQ